MTRAATPSNKACHNCRRRRLRCDRSYPACLKCAASAQQCLGYGALLRWTHAVASRGRMAGRTSFQTGHDDDKGDRPRGVAPDVAVVPQLVYSSLLDPLLKGLGPHGQFYAHHFATSVCGDLVSYDQPDQNPFRFMIPMMGEYPYLRSIVIATAAMHLATQHRCQGQPTGRALVHALSARGQAISQLRAAMTRITDDNRSVILATVVFLVNFDLVDSGRGTWKAHLDAAGVLINALQSRSDGAMPPEPVHGLDRTKARLLDMVVADCLTYHILGSTLTVVDERAAQVYDNINISEVLRRAEAYSYHCCPPAILQIVVCATRLSTTAASGSSQSGLGRGGDQTHDATSLLAQALAFDVRGWVNSIADLSFDDDREARVRLASAHRAAACLYILLIWPSSVGYRRQSEMCDAETLVEEILHNLSSVPSDHVLHKGCVWPTFLAGAQTDDLNKRRWCMLRLRAMWRSSPWVCPWGYVETAMKALGSVWRARDAVPMCERQSWNWLKQLKASSDIDCLIV